MSYGDTYMGLMRSLSHIYTHTHILITQMLNFVYNIILSIGGWSFIFSSESVTHKCNFMYWKELGEEALLRLFQFWKFLAIIDSVPIRSCLPWSMYKYKIAVMAKTKRFSNLS